MYTISKLTGKIYLNNIEIIQDDRLEEWRNMYEWQLNGGQFIQIEATPEEIAEQENQQKQELKSQAHDELLPTDWYVVRFIERGIAIPEEIKTQRQAILDKYNT